MSKYIDEVAYERTWSFCFYFYLKVMSLVSMRNRVALGETTDWLALLILCAHSIYAVEVPLVIF